MKLVCVVGPTGCGKTWLGVELSKALCGEVVSCDSMQLYRGMVIGTAAPTEDEMQGIPHHMVGVADPGENYSVARYAHDAAKCVDELIARGKQPVIVGGTGLYLNALLAGHGFAGGDKDGKCRAALEERWDKEGGEAMFKELGRIDPETAGRLHANDKKRILRALEVYCETGKTMAQHNAETKRLPPRYDSVRIGLAYEDREDMKRAIDLRVDKMVEAGLFDEVRALLFSGLSRDVTAMQAIGYQDQAPLAPVCQAPAHMAAPRQGHPLVSLGKNEGSCRLPRFFDRNSQGVWRILFLKRTDKSAKKKGSKSHEKNCKSSGPVSSLCPPRARERDRLSRQRLSDAGRRDRLRQLCCRARERRQAADALQARDLNDRAAAPHLAARGSGAGGSGPVTGDIS